MNTLDDLRSTLHRHADDLDDVERYIRPVAVRARIRVVRRRRAAIAAAALVVVAGLAGAGMMLRGSDGIDPADRVVVGVTVPDRVTALGRSYELESLADLTAEETHVDPAEHPQAVVLAASGLGDGMATLYSQGDPVGRVRGDEQVSAPVDLGEAGVDLEVRFDGAGPGARAGVAVYEATDDIPAGVGNRHAVFRGEVAGATLVAGGFSSPGEASLELQFSSRGGRLRFVFYCSSEADDLLLNVSIDGKDSMASGCGDSGAGADAGTGSSGTTRVPAGEHEVVAYLTHGDDGPQVTATEETVFGLGVYDPPAPGPRVLDTRVESQVEYAGRDWVFDRVLAAPATIDTADGDVLLGFVGSGKRLGATWSGRLTHGETTQYESPDTVSDSTGSLLLAGDRYRVRITGGEGRLLVYRPE